MRCLLIVLAFAAASCATARDPCLQLRKRVKELETKVFDLETQLGLIESTPCDCDAFPGTGD